MKKLILITILLIPFFVLSQTKKKEIVYLLFNENKKEKCKIQVEQNYENSKGVDYVKRFRKKTNKNEVYFSVCNEDFIYTKGISKTDTCSIKALKNIKIVSLDYLLKKYYTDNELKHHVFKKIYFIEKINETKIVKYEVYWSGEWSTKN